MGAVESRGKHCSRLVAEEVSTSKDDGLFAAAPLSESIKHLIAKLTMQEHARGEKDGRAEDDWITAQVDIHRALFYTRAQREVHLGFPAVKARDSARDSSAMHGLTKKIASEWQDECEAALAI